MFGATKVFSGSAAVASFIEGERTIDVREISPHIRHIVIFQLFEHLDEMRSLQLIADHDPRPLRRQLEAKHGARCRWTYLEQGPDIWRVRLRRGQQTNQAIILTEAPDGGSA